MAYEDLTREQLESAYEAVRAHYDELVSENLALNMARGKPGADQLDLSEPLLTILASAEDCRAQDGTDCRNYGVLEGIPEARALMAVLLDADPADVIVGGNSSLSLMYDTIARFMAFGTLGSRPWSELEEVKWLCPVPGYDRHFTITESFGIQNIPVPMDENGPVMDEVERLAASDSSIKGIWCVPKYSNPGGITYSDEVVRRLGSMETAAKDFRIMWDNAYAVHHLFDDPADQDQLLDISIPSDEAGNPDRYVKFASTSKVTLPGAGIAALAASPANIAEIKSHMAAAIISGDKLNQLRHVRFLKDASGIAAHMASHGAILRPKFTLVDKALHEGLDGVGGCSWSTPRGGYFVSFNAPEGTATRAVALAKEAGVVMTGAGATWPGGADPQDSNIRIAPTLPPVEELQTALDVFTTCVKLAYLEKLLA